MDDEEIRGNLRVTSRKIDQVFQGENEDEQSCRICGCTWNNAWVDRCTYQNWIVQMLDSNGEVRYQIEWFGNEQQALSLALQLEQKWLKRIQSTK